MATSPLLLIPHITQGQKQKEVTANQAFDILESAIAGQTSFDAAGTGSISIGDAGSRPMVIELTGILTGDKTVVVPQRTKLYIFLNNTTGSFDCLIDTGIGTPLKLPNGFYAFIYCDATDCLELTRLISDRNRTITVSDDLELFDEILFCDTTAGSITVTLPAVIPIGQKFLIVKTVAANTLTIGRNSNTINAAAADVTATTNQQAMEVIGQAAGNWLAYDRALAT